MGALVRCDRRVVVDGRLAAFEGQMITREDAERLGILHGETAPEKQPEKAAKAKGAAPRRSGAKK